MPAPTIRGTVVPNPTGHCPQLSEFDDQAAWYEAFKTHNLAATNYATSLVVLASFVYKHLDDKEEDAEEMAVG